TPADVEQDAEDEVVDRHVQQRREHLPDLAEPGLGVHRHVARGGEDDDEVAPAPQLPQVLQRRGPGGGRREAVLECELGERLVRQAGRLGRDRDGEALWAGQAAGRVQTAGPAPAAGLTQTSCVTHNGEPMVRGGLPEHDRELYRATVTYRTYHRPSCAVQLF